MLVAYGTWEIRYCVAQVNVRGTEAEVRYYAFLNNGYGLHLTDNIEDEAVLWYDTEKEAQEHIFNANECVVSRGRDV